MSMFMAAMRQELREKGRIHGFSGMSSAAWEIEVRDYERKLAAVPYTPEVVAPTDAKQR